MTLSAIKIPSWVMEWGLRGQAPPTPPRNLSQQLQEHDEGVAHCLGMQEEAIQRGFEMMQLELTAIRQTLCHMAERVEKLETKVQPKKARKR